MTIFLNTKSEAEDNSYQQITCSLLARPAGPDEFLRLVENIFNRIAPKQQCGYTDVDEYIQTTAMQMSWRLALMRDTNRRIRLVRKFRDPWLASTCFPSLALFEMQGRIEPGTPEAGLWCAIQSQVGWMIALSSPEVEPWLAIRREEALNIDLETPEVCWDLVDQYDPYSVCEAYPWVCQSAQTEYFVRSRCGIWVWFGDLPVGLREALLNRIDAGLTVARPFDDV
jgi:hypothetical protein